jgi:hypothetical protein
MNIGENEKTREIRYVPDRKIAVPEWPVVSLEQSEVMIGDSWAK